MQAILRVKYYTIIFLVLFLGPISMFAQNTNRYYHNADFYLFLSKDGTYEMGDFFSTISIVHYMPQHVYSYGHYTKKGRYYVLDADSSILENQGQCKNYITRFSHSNQIDGFTVSIHSPYETRVQESEHLSRVFTYTIYAYMEDGSMTQLTDTLNRIVFQRTAEPNKLRLHIGYCPNFYLASDFYFFSHSPYCYVEIDSIPEGSNMVQIEFPALDYFTLVYAPYHNYKVKIINRNKLLFNGDVYKKTGLYRDVIRAKRIHRRMMRLG